MSNKEYTEEEEDEFFEMLELDNEANENTKIELLASIIIVLSSIFVLWAVVALCDYSDVFSEASTTSFLLLLVVLLLFNRNVKK